MVFYHKYYITEIFLWIHNIFDGFFLTPFLFLSFSLGRWAASLHFPSRVPPPPPCPWISPCHIPSRRPPPTRPALFRKHGCPWRWARTSCRCRCHVKTAATGRCTAFSTRRCWRPSLGSSRSSVCRTPFSGRSTRGESLAHCWRYPLFI